MHRFVRDASLALTLAVLLLAPGESRGQAVLPDPFADQLVAGGLSYPVGMAFLPDHRVLVVEQVSARVLLAIGDAPATVRVIGTIPGVNTTGGERGLLGIAVDPGWPGRPYVYVHSTALGNPNSVVISRFTLGGDLSFTGDGILILDPASRYDVFRVPDVHTTHNGGTVRFGPDGRLYASL